VPYIRSGSLARQLHRGEPLDPVRTQAVACQIADALRYAHEECGIYHRDVKPANVLIDQHGVAYLVDFGLSRTADNDSLVFDEQLVGTLAYLAPGVAAGLKETASADIYGFGATLYEMLTGEQPYVGDTPTELLRRISAGPPEPILQRNPQAPPGLVRVAEGCMARELRDRYASMADVLGDLERVERGTAPVGPHGHPAALARRPHLWQVGWLVTWPESRTGRVGLVAFWLILLAFTGLIAAFGPWRRDPNPQDGTPSGPVSQDLQLTLAVTAFRGKPAHRIGQVGQHVHAVQQDDWVQVDMTFGEPCFSYLIAFDPTGKATLRVPRDERVPPERLQSPNLRYPADPSRLYHLDDGDGVQAFAVLASRRPLPSYAAWKAGLGSLPWRQVTGDGVWRFDARQLELVSERGHEEQWPGLPEPLDHLCQRLKDRPEFDAVRLLAFPVRPKQPQVKPGDGKRGPG
jgi:hypothetical protein